MSAVFQKTLPPIRKKKPVIKFARRRFTEHELLLMLALRYGTTQAPFTSIVNSYAAIARMLNRKV